MFQHVWLSNFPAVYPRTHLVLRVRGRRTEIGIHTIRIRFVDEAGTELWAARAPFSSESPRRVWSTSKPGRFSSSTFPCPGPDQYAFEISLDGELASRVALSAGYPQQCKVRVVPYLTSDSMTWTRDRALALMHEYTPSDALRKHMYAVEIAMRAMAERAGEDPESWGLVGLLHDFDYERFPNSEHSATEGHPAEGVRILAAGGFPEPMQRAILGHANYSGVPRDTPMARALFAVDELAGFLVACALVRPSRSLQDLEVSSVKKKLKDKAFARGVSRDDVVRGAEELGVPLDEHIAFMLAALRPHERTLGLGAP